MKVPVERSSRIALPTDIVSPDAFPADVQKVLVEYQSIHRHEFGHALRDIAVREFMSRKAAETLGDETGLWNAARLTEFGVQFTEGRHIAVPYTVFVNGMGQPRTTPSEERFIRLAEEGRTRTDALEILLGMNAQFLRDWIGVAEPILQGGKPTETDRLADNEMIEHYMLSGPRSVIEAFQANGVTVTNADAVLSATVTTQIEAGVELNVETSEATGTVAIVEDPVTQATELHVHLVEDASRAPEDCQRIATELSDIAVFGLQIASAPTFSQLVSRVSHLQHQPDDGDSKGHGRLESAASVLPAASAQQLHN